MLLTPQSDEILDEFKDCIPIQNVFPIQSLNQ